MGELFLYLEGLVEAVLGEQCCIVEKDPETKEPPHVLTNFKKVNYELLKGDVHIDTGAEEVWSLLVNLSVEPTHPPFIGREVPSFKEHLEQNYAMYTAARHKKRRAEEIANDFHSRVRKLEKNEQDDGLGLIKGKWSGGEVLLFNCRRSHASQFGCSKADSADRQLLYVAVRIRGEQMNDDDWKQARKFCKGGPKRQNTRDLRTTEFPIYLAGGHKLDGYLNVIQKETNVAGIGGRSRSG